MTLNKLAERVEQASGPDRELDVEICVALQHGGEGAAGAVNVRTDPGWPGDLVFEIDGEEYCNPIPPVTASLDAALSLVPEGWSRWCHDADNGRAICRLERGDKEVGAQADTWALAILAAALRAQWR